MAFVPGDLVYIDSHVLKASASKTVYRFERMERCYCSNTTTCPRSPWNMTAHSIMCDGMDFGHHEEEIPIAPYEGFRSLTSLPVMPLKYHPDQKKIKDELILRGRKYRTLGIGRHHMNYDGFATVGRRRAANRHSFDRSFDKQRAYVGFAIILDISINAKQATGSGRLMIDSEAGAQYVPDHEPEFSANKRIFRCETDDHLEMTDEDLIICTAELVAYSLSNMKWGFFKVECATDVVYDNEAFASLLIDQDYKDTVLSLVRIHADERAMYDDVIAGKGKGMVMLLHGPPGVGKSLTAESVAEHTKKPLMRLQAGTLGASPAEVEDALSDAFSLAVKWDAVALLDEADVFLEQRDSENLERNRLVSIFLRVLEFYQGILFLTTNRVAAFDGAIMSRVHIAITYPALDRASQQSLWILFLSRLPNDAGRSLVDKGDLGTLDEYDMDGREIKNIVRTAHSLAVSDASGSVGLNHLRKALKIRQLQLNMAVPGFKDRDGHDESGRRGTKRQRLDDVQDE
ncbi:P-loop containing nucleoside triphosphate hydrolase protein [Apiospora hydei]|uniref:P-loop containing nucleoside triphosphate hydrolase protein n=1 Tax=Apiospora hydei TaxID=1337664 RepID=A0ABR1WNT6_9PEZI